MSADQSLPSGPPRPVGMNRAERRRRMQATPGFRPRRSPSGKGSPAIATHMGLKVGDHKTISLELPTFDRVIDEIAEMQANRKDSET